MAKKIFFKYVYPPEQKLALDKITKVCYNIYIRIIGGGV